MYEQEGERKEVYRGDLAVKIVGAMVPITWRRVVIMRTASWIWKVSRFGKYQDLQVNASKHGI